MAYDNAAVIRRFFDEVWTKGNLGVVDELVSPSCITLDPIGGEMKGRESLKAFVTQYRNAFADLRFVIEDLVVSGDKVVVRWTAIGKHTGPLMGVAPSGKTHSLEGISWSRLSNGKLVESRAQWDTVRFLQNLGLMPVLGAEAPRPQAPEARPH